MSCRESGALPDNGTHGYPIVFLVGVLVWFLVLFMVAESRVSTAENHEHRCPPKTNCAQVWDEDSGEHISQVFSVEVSE